MLGTLSVREVLQTASNQEHENRVRAWAESVWKAWAVHHDVMVDRPCFPHRFSPGSHPVLVLLVRSGLQDFSHTQGPEHGGRLEPLAAVFELGNGKHRVIRISIDHPPSRRRYNRERCTPTDLLAAGTF